MSDTKELTSLGATTKRNFRTIRTPQPQWLETFQNAHKGIYLVPFVQPEATFRSLCPKTGQPDSARMEIVYVPNDKMVESKSLKEYLQSFQNSGEFHEDVTNRIAKDLYKLMEPKYIRVYADFVVRGDLAIKPMVEMWGKQTSEAEAAQIIRMVGMFDTKYK
jgi:7-cyano-7-deazaguanine reductase